MSGKSYRFVDTNILVYAHDRSAGQKHEKAKAILQSLWASQMGCLNIQVLQEFYVTITRKVCIRCQWQMHHNSLKIWVRGDYTHHKLKIF